MSTKKSEQGGEAHQGPRRTPDGRFASGPSHNVDGRPRKAPRLPLPRQFLQDIVTALSVEVTVKTASGSVRKPKFLATLDVMIQKALTERHAPNGRFVIKLYESAVNEIARREHEMVDEVDLLFEYLKNGASPEIVQEMLHGLADTLNQWYKTPGRRIRRGKAMPPLRPGSKRGQSEYGPRARGTAAARLRAERAGPRASSNAAVDHIVEVEARRKELAKMVAKQDAAIAARAASQADWTSPPPTAVPPEEAPDANGGE